ncbi:hypothetical protein [Deinococcus multiflagellatus]|uniref:Uncharacterized protein n=1 Tax=Deinococcus multiflagellatus TaxID=1656887 RepID=A0ABW1ZT80_9DEIO
MTLTPAPLNLPLPPQARAVTLSHLMTSAALIPTALHLHGLAAHCPQLFIVVTSDLPEATGLTATGALVVLKDISDRSPLSVVHFPPGPSPPPGS